MAAGQGFLLGAGNIMKHGILIPDECWWCGGVRCGCAGDIHNRYALCPDCYKAVNKIVKSHGDYMARPGRQTVTVVTLLYALAHDDETFQTTPKFMRQLLLNDPHPKSVERN